MSRFPSLEEVKKHFENARLVKCLNDGFIHDVENRTTVLDTDFSKEGCIVYRNGTYAEIVEYINPIKEMTFTLDQIAKHGELILELSKDPSILIEKKQSTGWLLATCPRFDEHTEYRKRPDVSFRNELGEEFTKEDVKNNIYVFFYDWFCFNSEGACLSARISSLNSYGIDEATTSISKTHLGALKLAVKHLEDESSTNN